MDHKFQTMFVREGETPPEEDNLQQELEMPLSLRDKMDLDCEVDFFAAGNNDDYEKPLTGLKSIGWQPMAEDPNDHRRRFRSEEYPNNENAGASQSQQGWYGMNGGKDKPKILNYKCEVRRRLK